MVVHLYTAGQDIEQIARKYKTIQYSTVTYSTVQYNMILYPGAIRRDNTCFFTAPDNISQLQNLK